MKKLIKLLGAGIVIASLATLSSCHDEQAISGGHGVLKISTKIKSEVVSGNTVNSRANSEELGESLLMHIYNSKGLVRRYEGLSSVPTDGIKLVADKYTVKAWAGDSVSASFDHQYFKGMEDFEISGGQTTGINLECGIANVVVALSFDPDIDQYLTDYKMTIGHKRGSLEFVGQDSRRGYFMMPSTDKNLTWKLEGTKAGPVGGTYTREGTIANAAPGTLYTLRLHLPTDEDDISGGFLTIEIDETPLDEITHNVEIEAAPVIYGYGGLDINEPVMAETGKVGHLSVVVAASCALTDVYLSNDELGALVGDSDRSNTSYNLMRQTESFQKLLETAGISYFYEYFEEDQDSQLKISFDDNFTNRLEAKEYKFTISATDANNKTTTKTLTINCEDAPVMPAAVNNDEVWATSATVSGKILKENVPNPGVAYRVKSSGRADGEWMHATDVRVSGNTYSATLTDLQPGTTYEYTVTAEGYMSTNIQSFVTEGALQLPNFSFEEWDESGKAHLIYAPDGEIFWDSGNHGSSTMSKNVTTRSTEKHHAGSASAKLSSQFVGIGDIGKFAAGNVFIGEYLTTDGTDGVLGWGRAWTSRPKAVTAWVHYTPATIDNVNGKKGSTSGNLVDKDGNTVASITGGTMDRGIIYVAILDGTTKTDPKASDKPYPVIVNTKSKTFFDKNGDNVIAYGEIILDKATEGDAMVQVRIPLTYRSNKKASNIMLTASASQYGDYFTGGHGSVLYLDDIQLEY